MNISIRIAQHSITVFIDFLGRIEMACTQKEAFKTINRKNQLLVLSLFHCQQKLNFFLLLSFHRTSSALVSTVIVYL